ncbi:MAG: hypothetical protein SGPRY_008959, partial [Prymnesium sp.]
ETARPSAASQPACDESYTPPAARSVEELLSVKEGEDEALQRYKAALLGPSPTLRSHDPRRLLLSAISILPADRPPIPIDLSSRSRVAIKEGCEYRLQFEFTVQNELLSGLRYSRVVTRMGIQLENESHMLGSFAPDPHKVITVQVPRRDWEIAPSGMLARATYTVKSSFTDDDKVEHWAYSFELEVKKDWG